MDISVRLAEQQNKTETAIKKQSICPMVNALFAFKLIEKEGSRKIEKIKKLINKM